jgi:predicted transcriptional regulator
MDKYLMNNIEPVINVAKECMGDGEVKTITQISKFYKTESHFIVKIFEYLYDKKIIDKISQTIRITPKGKMLFEEAAFIMVESKNQ